jgi:dinuclear metal center YbgI/SA1388 family protein
MLTTNDVLKFLRQLAPEEEALDQDPVGLLISMAASREIKKIGVCLDATPAIAARAVKLEIDLIIVHHPLIYAPIKRLHPDSDPIAASVTSLIKGDISLYAMHTNWDRAHGGINDTLAKLVCLENFEPLGSAGSQTLPRIGELPVSQTAAQFFDFINNSLVCSGTNSLRTNRVEPGKRIKRVAVCGGAGAFLMPDVIAAGADAYVTSDVRHHEFIEATGRNLLLLDAGHDATETPGMQELVPILQEKFHSLAVVWLGNEELVPAE